MADEAVRRREEGFTAAAGGVLSQIGGHCTLSEHIPYHIHTHIHTVSDPIQNTNSRTHKKNKEVQLLVFIITPYLIFVADATD